MKMESTVTAPMAGEVVAVSVSPNAQVEAGHPSSCGCAAFRAAELSAAAAARG